MITSPKDFFEEIGRFEPISGLFLTYTLDRDVIEKLAEVCPGTVIILHDHRHGVSLEDNHRHKVVCLPVAFSKEHAQHCFHPKLALLRNETEAMIMIGSANLSRDAFVREKELVATGRMELDHPVCTATIRFLESLAGYLVNGSDILLDALKRFEVRSAHPPEDPEKHVFFNQTQSVFEQLDGLLPREQVFESIHIISPFLPKDPNLLEQFRKRFVANKYRFHLRLSDKTTQAIKTVFPDAEIVSPAGNSSFHYKAYIFRTRQTDYIALGSANFTTQGFFRSAEALGNMESMLLLPLPASDQLTTWLKNGWKKPVAMADVLADDSAALVSEEFQETPLPYAYAEREEKRTRVVLYLPESFSIRQLSCKPALFRDWEPMKDLPGFYEGYTGICQQVVLSSRTPKWEEKICAFDQEEFKNLYTYYGDSLFSESDKTNSIRSKELRDALHRSGRSVRVGHSMISQRPFLEQFFRNLHTRLEFLGRKRYFSAWHESELQSVLEAEEGGVGCYQLLKLLQFFSRHPAGEVMAQLCREQFGKYRSDERFRQMDLDALLEVMENNHA